MKIMISLLFILMLSGCSFKDVSDSIYIASVAIEKANNEYKGYFYLPSSVEVGNSNPDNTSKKGEIGISSGQSITDVFYNIEFSTSLSINYAHIASMVFHESILNNDDIDSLLQFFKNSDHFDFNFYIFTTKEKIEDIYTFTNPNKESVINTLLVEPHNLKEQFLTANAVHYLNFCNYFYSNRCIHIPLIEIDYSWKIDDKEIEAYSARGLCYYHNGDYAIYGYDDQRLEYLKSNELIYYSDTSVSTVIKNYKVKYCYKDDLEISICGTIDRVVLNDNIDIEAYISNVIKEYLMNAINNINIDFLNLEYYSKLYKKDYTLEDIVFNIKIKTVD